MVCRIELAGCVPSLQHTVIPDYSEGGPLAESWATKPASAFKLLCPSGGCADPEEFESCTFGRVRALHPSPPAPPSFLFSKEGHHTPRQFRSLDLMIDDIDMIGGCNDPSHVMFKHGPPSLCKGTHVRSTQVLLKIQTSPERRVQRGKHSKRTVAESPPVPVPG